jgi:hypothetical protein
VMSIIARAASDFQPVRMDLQWSSRRWYLSFPCSRAADEGQPHVSTLFFGFKGRNSRMIKALSNQADAQRKLK